MRRRRLIAVAAAAAGATLLPGPAGATPPRVTWRGSALGAEASLTLVGADPERARRLIAQALAEVERLEAIFSLQRAESALSRLNRDGRLDAPPLELRLVLAEARRIAALSAGAFDVTVQPLWRLYADHFARPGAPADGPTTSQVARALGLVDWRAVELDRAAIRLRRPGMALTLNGIAQGCITDRVAALLRDAGMERALVDLGEIRAFGEPEPGRPWRLGLAGDGPPLETGTTALATSAPAATTFEPSGRFHHLLDPRSGRPAEGPRRVTVLAESAMLADALSTAVAVAPAPAAWRVLAEGGASRAIVETAKGDRETWAA
jgi:thiamine biosynthesis lipoprotein